MKLKTNNVGGLTKKTLSGLLWAFSATGAQGILQVLALMILARLIVPNDFGLIGAALTVIGISTLFSQLGVGAAIVQLERIEERHLRTAFTICFGLGVASTVLIYYAAPIIASFFKMERAQLVIRIMSISFLFQSVSVVARSLLQRAMRFRELSGIQVFSYVAGYCGVSVGLAVVGYGVWALVLGYLVEHLLSSILLLSVQHHPKRPLFHTEAAKELLNFGGWLTGGQISNYIALQADNIVVGRCLGANALGLYGRAYQLMVGPSVLFGQVLNKVLFPAMARAQNQPQNLSVAYRRGCAAIGLITIPVSGIVIILAPEIINLILGPDWKEMVTAFRILVVGMYFRLGYKLGGTLAQAVGAAKGFALSQGAYAVMVIGGALVGQMWGIKGVASGTLVAILVNFLVLNQLSMRLVSLKWKDVLTAQIPGLFTAGVTSAIGLACVAVLRGQDSPDWLTLAICLLFGCIVVILGYRLCPERMVGGDCRWIINILGDYFAERGMQRLWRKG